MSDLHISANIYEKSVITANISNPISIIGKVFATGKDGKDGDAFFTFDQQIANSEWIIEHDLNKYPSVTVVDSAGSIVIGEVEYLSMSVIKVTFAHSFSGKAYLN